MAVSEPIVADVVPKRLDDHSRDDLEMETPESKISRRDDATSFKRKRMLLWLPLGGYLCAAMVNDAERAIVPLCLASVVLACQLWDAFRSYRGEHLDKLGKQWNSFVAPFTFWILGAIVLALIGLTVSFAWEDWQRLVPAAGLLLLVFLTWVCSAHRCHIRWRPVITGILLQFLIGLLIMRTTFGFNAFQSTGKAVSDFLAFTEKGSEFVFGDNYKETLGGAFVFNVLPVVIFFSSMVAAAYHLGLVQAVFLRIGWLMQVVMGTSYCESLMSAANIFLGQTEAPLLAKPFLAHLTCSEIHAVMTAGFASIAGGVMAAYISFNIPADHLLAASVMSCPAALAMAKLSYPETEICRTDDLHAITRDESVNVLDAMATGVMTGISLAASIAGMLIAFVAAMAFLNSALEWTGSLVGLEGLTFDLVMSYIMWPLAFMMGVPQEDCLKVGLLIGEKTVLNEFVAYRHLADMVKKGEISQKAEIIATYALCGFSNFASIGVQIGGLSTLAPSRKHDFARLAFRAMATGSVACFMTGCIAGILITDWAA